MIKIHQKIEAIRSNLSIVRLSLVAIDKALTELEGQVTVDPLDPPDLNDLMRKELIEILNKALRKND